MRDNNMNLDVHLINVSDLSEDQILAIGDWQARQILKGKICPVCQGGFPDSYNAILTDKIADGDGYDLVFTHETCLNNLIEIEGE